VSDEESNLPELSGETRSRAEIAYLMKRQGLSLSDIAVELHVTPQAVADMLADRFAYEAQFLKDDERSGILAMENARLDYYLTKLWPSVEYGDLKAIAEARKISEVRVKINQVDKLSSTATTQVLVVGGESADYVEALKGMAND
jgi:hypothetical protein